MTGYFLTFILDGIHVVVAFCLITNRHSFYCFCFGKGLAARSDEMGWTMRCVEITKT